MSERFDKQWESDVDTLGDGLLAAFNTLTNGTDMTIEDVIYLTRGTAGRWHNHREANGLRGLGHE